MDLLEAFVKVAPYINQLCNEEITVAVADMEKHICYVRGKTIEAEIPVGTPLKKEQALYKAIFENRRVETELPPSLWGTPIKAIALPVHDKNNNVIGGVVFATDIGNVTHLAMAIEKLNSSATAISQAIKSLSIGMEKSANFSQEMMNTSSKVEESTKKTENILKFSSKVAQQSNLLGLNAAIEAARAGANGAGFSVVAEEIRKLSLESSQSTEHIRRIVIGINEGMGKITEMTKEFSANSQEQMANILQISGAMEEIARSIETIGGFVNRLK
jgi:hypothetical protein